MRFPGRRDVGLAMVAASILAGLTLQWTTENLVTTEILEEDMRVTDSGFVWTGCLKSHWNWRHVAPLALISLVGAALVAWPTRKPPKLPT